ncbi:sortase [Paenibacillus alvei]|uniref:class D sortase n=1 Tax=Paenibacillus alvei TaxID=44250 RepID=UPI0018CE288A|nr:class D sortase [Paenibacillus alvei]MBG9733630.1 sortase [Paenibacillus alvei]MBG9744038.1 sortase [Paenibacillus alvei]MCY9588204.1 class D sortase [Paenibacillus alvei]
MPLISKKRLILSRLIGAAALLLLLTGLALILFPKWNEYNEQQRELRLLTEWDNLPQDIIPVSSTSESDPAAEKKKLQPKVIDGLHVYGTISIAKIDLREPMVEGATPASLKVGSGIVVPERMPGELGNFVLASHRSLTFGRHFNRLDELTAGDKIQLETAAQTYTYTVQSKSIVVPEDLSVLDQNPDARELTLITCEPIDTATHRLIVKAVMDNTL